MTRQKKNAGKTTHTGVHGWSAVAEKILSYAATRAGNPLVKFQFFSANKVKNT
jgi:hypothetical protein